MWVEFMKMHFLELTVRKISDYYQKISLKVNLYCTRFFMDFTQ